MHVLIERELYPALCVALALALMVTIGVATVDLLRRTRPDLRLWVPLGVGAVVRFGAAIVTSFAPLSSLAGPDERGFLSEARQKAESLSWWDWLSDDLPASLFDVAGSLNSELLVLQLKILGQPGVLALRVVQIGIAVIGVALVAGAVHDLAGARAAGIAAWLLALEPTSAFYSGVLNKEAFVFLGEGLFLLGAARLWTLGDWRGIATMAVGCLVAGGARPYAGAFLAAAGLLITLHFVLRGRNIGGSRLAASMVAAGAIMFGVGFSVASATGLLDELNRSQITYTTDFSNLALDPVDYSSPAAVAQNLPQRVWDFVVRPVPWEATNLSQRLGVAGTLLFWLVIASVGWALLRSRGLGLARIVPLFYVVGAVCVGYALTTANAGTGFRYRTHLLLVLLASLATLASDALNLRHGRLARLESRLRRIRLTGSS